MNRSSQKSEAGSQGREVVGVNNYLVTHGSLLKALRQWSLLKSCWLLLLIISFTFSCSSGGDAGGAKVQARLDNKELKYFTNGKKLYTQHCSNCHMDNGQGLGKLIPPLKNSDFLYTNMALSAQMIINGYEAPLVVNGTEYNQPMPANKNLNPTEVIEILTYISNAWGNDYGSVNEAEIKSALSR